MFGIWRHRRRQATEERLTAYVDAALGGRPDAPAAALEELPGPLRREAEELRLTASMLRSVESVRAPRSFALTAAPAHRPESERPRWSFLTPQAPALAAAAAAVALAVLVSGDLGGWLNQGGERLAGVPGPSAAPESQFAAPFGTPVPPAAEAAPAAAPLAPAAGASEALAAPAAPRAVQEPLPGGTSATPSPPAAPAASSPPQPASGLIPPTAPAMPGEGDGARALAAPPLAAPAELDRAIAGEQAPPMSSEGAGERGGGLSLPLRQLEIAFGALAAALGGLAVFRAHRR